MMLVSMEESICCFERLTGTEVVVYTSDEVFRYGTRAHWMHGAAFCRDAKTDGEGSCISFDSEKARSAADFFAAGAVKICPAGALEWGYALRAENRVVALLFAGLRRPPEVFPPDIPLLKASCGRAGCQSAALPALRRGELADTMEALRQLGARLLEQYNVLADLDRAERSLPPADYIRSVIYRKSSGAFSLPDLAGILHLSVGRTAHRVKELTGCGFAELLLSARLEHASRLLVNTPESVSEIAERSGFGSTANFHRMFLRRNLCTPLQFRRNGGRAAAAENFRE